MILVFTGAGISKQSNIPTFNERPDIREKLVRSFAKEHPIEYNQVLKQLKETVKKATPNAAHKILAKYNIPIITMNIDGLHKIAGSDALELHGSLPADEELDIAYSLYNKPVLYDDLAPNYQIAYQRVGALHSGDIFLIVGVSYHTAIANDLAMLAKSRGATIIEVQEDAVVNVPRIIKEIMENKIYVV